MLNTFFSAKLANYHTIKVALFSNVTKGDNVPILLYDNQKKKFEGEGSKSRA